MCSNALLSSRVSLRAGTHRAARFSNGRAGMRAGFGGLEGAEFGFPGALVTTVQSRAMPVCSEPLVHEQRSSDCRPPFTTTHGGHTQSRSRGHFSRAIHFAENPLVHFPPPPHLSGGVHACPDSH